MEEQHKDLIEHLPDAFLEVDILTPRLKYMNRAAYHLFGYSKKDFNAGIALSALFAKNEYQRAEKIAKNYIKKNIELKLPYEPASEQIIYEFQMKKKDGSLFHAETQSSFVLDENCMPIAMRTVIRDATARKEAEEALRESEEKYRQLYENAPSMYFTVDVHGEVLLVNKFGATQLGYKVEELVGKSVFNVFHEEDRKEVKKQLATCLKNLHQIYQWDFRKLRKDGSVMWVREVARAIQLSDDKISALIVCEDITDKKKADLERLKLQAKLQHAQKLESLGELAGGIAHKFNNLLTGILGNAGLALLDLPPESSTRDSVQFIEKSALQAAELTNQMLAYAGKGKYIVQAHNLSKLIGEMAELLETVIPKKVHIEYDLEKNLPDIEADSSQIQQVIMNLVTNSADAIGKSTGVIRVSTGNITVGDSYFSETILNDEFAPGEYVYVEIKDTGCGMDSETQSKIFDPFYSTKFAGRGLGLAAVLGIVRGHRGAIKLASQPEHGTNIKIIFPISGKSTALKNQSIKTGRGANKATILIIDDEEIARSVAKKTLEKFGFNVLLAKDGAEGVKVFRQHASRINGVLLDMTMPKMNGEEALGELRRTDPDIPVILSSGFDERMAIARFEDKGLAGFIQKPYQPRDLVEKFNEILEN